MGTYHLAFIMNRLPLILDLVSSFGPSCCAEIALVPLFCCQAHQYDALKTKGTRNRYKYGQLLTFVRHFMKGYSKGAIKDQKTMTLLSSCNYLFLHNIVHFEHQCAPIRV